MKKIFLLALFLINFLSFSQRGGLTDSDGNPIEITPIDPNEPVDPSPTIPTSSGFHDTQGKFEVSNNGQATYTLPIALPPSIQSVGPTINLVYSSGQMGGIAGQGWNINSISSIARIATRKDIDGFVDGVDFDDNDKLALDGQRLILVSGNYWADGSIYKTEVLSNSKIELKGSGTSMYFIVTAPDGSRSWYGNFGGQNASDLTAFYIVRFEDTNGNFITYHYNKPYNKALCINEIKFSANINGLPTPLNRIKFNYVLAKRTENVYIKGVKHEKVELLKNIVVYTNNQQFRKYVLTHDLDTQLGYERVIQLQEFNSNNEPANPVVFEYTTTTMDNINSESVTTYNNNLNFNDIELSGDFDGDGRMDFLTENGLYKNLFQGVSGQTPLNLPFTVDKKNFFVATTLNNNKLNNFNSIVKSENGSLKVYNLVGNNLVFSYQKDYSFPYHTGCFNILFPCDTVEPNYIEGDFNGDGLSDVISYNFCKREADQYSGGGYECSDFYWLDLNPNVSSIAYGGFPGVSAPGAVVLASAESLQGKKRFVADFNGDGKSDILAVNKYNKNYFIVGLKQLDVAPWQEIEILGQGTLDKFSDTKQLLLGDFNGDGKTDVMLPDTEGGSGHTLWHIYYANPNPIGGEYFVKESHNIVEYWPNTGGYYDKQTHFSNYYALDTNGDGKSDVVRVWRKHYKPSWTINDYNTQWTVKSYSNNIGNTQISGNKFTLDYSSVHNHDSDSPDLVIPIVSNYKYKGIDRDLILVHNHYDRIFYIKFKKDVSEDVRLKKVMASNGNIIDQIDYQAMEPTSNLNNGLGGLNEFYSSNNSASYPFVELTKTPSYYLVSRITNTSGGFVKSQDFRYHGLVVNMHGLGIVGFNKTARSAWYLNSNPSAKRLWNVFESNYNWRGALSRSYSQLLNTGNVFSFVNGINPSGIVNSTVNTFTDVSLNGYYKIQLDRQIIKDFITGVTTETNYTYDSEYLLPNIVEVKNYLVSSSSPDGIKTTTTIFDNNPNGLEADYHIGRPLETTSTTIAYGGTSTSKEIFTYSGNKLIKTEKKGNTLNNKFLVEEFEYNDVGNVIKKTLSSTGYTPEETFTPRVTEYTYDTTERFVKTSKDIEGLITTNVSFHPIYGIVTETLSPFGLTSKVYVDYWGKVFKSTDYLNKNTSITYAKSGNEFITTKNGDEGSSSILINDALGRPIKSGQKNIEGSWSYKVVEYDYLGRKFRESEPFNSGSPSQWKTTTFDDYGRQHTVQYPSGLSTTLTYSGLTVTGTDGIKTTSSTKNANGHVITASDNGGNITYEYFADGSLKSSNYNNTIVSMEYDEWGRKKKLNDPSAGEYSYSYNALGELLKETTPNGTTTYVYDDFGKVIDVSVIGNNTHGHTMYEYDPSTKLPTHILYTDYNNSGINEEYFYEYDSYKRIIKTTENKFRVNFINEITYDSFGRVETNSYKAQSDDLESLRITTNTYKYGYHWQMIDNETSQILWQSNTVNSRGQLLTATLGNGIQITNSYDNFGFPTQFKHDKAGVGNVITLNTNFEPQRGNLISRYNSLFNWNENFQYDNLDRLTHYTNVLGQQVQQIYEIDGRIKENNLGKYNYTNSSKKYQNSSIDLNPDSKDYYENRLGIFNDGMETKQGWTNYEPSVFSFDETIKRSGNVSFKIANTTATEKVVNSDVWTKIDNAVPTEYTYSVWVKSDGTNPEAEIFLFMKTENETGYFTQVDQKVTATSNDWVLIEKTFLVPANIKKLNIRLDNNATGNLWFDDVRIRKTSDGDNGERKLNISYNTWKSPYQIEETNVDKISFTYNYMNNRSTIYYGGLQNNKEQRQFFKSYSADGTMEVKINNYTNEVEFLTYIGGDAYSAPVILKSNGTTQNYLYLHRDYLGSIVAITNGSGNILEKRLFDAWGEVIKVQDGQGNVLNGFKVLDRGYTGHEHLQSVGLIHMNGRLYDPKLHRFLQPDNFIQDPYNTQNYNRYAYVLNNPLKYVDPSGEELLSFTAAVLIGAAIAATTYTLTALLADVPFTAGGLLKATFIGAASAAVTYGIGTYATTIESFSSRIVFQAFAHGASQTTFASIQGGDPFVGFASGALSSMASSLWSGGSNISLQGEGSFAVNVASYNQGISGALGVSNNFGTLIFGTVAGGAGAALTGGNFWQGAATGLVVGFLNHAAHGGFAKKYKFHVMLDEDGARGFGHHAISGELDNGKLRFISKNGTSDPNDMNFSGESDYTNEIFNNIDEIQNYYGTKITPGHSFNKIDTYLMTRSQMNRAFDTGLQIAKQNYHLLLNSCTNVVTRSLFDAYKPSSSPYYDITPNINHVLQRANYYNHYIYSSN